MALAAMIVAVVALAFGAVGIGVPAGTRTSNVCGANRGDGASEALAVAYGVSRRRLERNRERLRALRAERLRDWNSKSTVPPNSSIHSPNG
jgi:hypothetical protein